MILQYKIISHDITVQNISLNKLQPYNLKILNCTCLVKCVAIADS